MSKDDRQGKIDVERGQPGGESAGGAYPNPHSGKDGKADGFMGHGGQTEMPYHGSGQLGAQKTGDNANAPATTTGSNGAGEQADQG